MRLKKDNILGTYIPAFFEMQVDTDINDFDLQKMSNHDLCVFLHEYIHFLQDITTVYGLNNIYVYTEYVSSVVNRIYKNGSNTFEVPFQITDNNDNVLLNRNVSSITLGDTEDSNISIFCISNIDIGNCALVPNTIMQQINDVTLSIKTNNGSDEFYTFGAMTIMENMAYIIERFCYPKDYTKSPDIPYTIAEKVSDYYVPNFSKNIEMVLALCEMSLMTSNPGYYYVIVMQAIKNGNLVFNTPESIYEHFYSLQTCTWDNKMQSLVEFYENLSERVATNMKKYVHGENITEDFDLWIDTIKVFSENIRNNKESFFLNIARGGQLKSNKYFQNIINTIGSPLLTNNKSNYFKIPHKNLTNKSTQDVEYFRAIKQMIDLFEYGKVECELFEWCKNSPINHTNDYCKKCPWEKNESCYYVFLWHNWKLTKHTPIIQ